MEEVTKYNFKDLVANYASEYVIKNIAYIVADYFAPSNPTNEDIGKYSIEILRPTVTYILDFLRGIGNSSDIDFIEKLVANMEEEKRTNYLCVIFRSACSFDNRLIINYLLSIGIEPGAGIVVAYLHNHKSLTKELLEKGASYDLIWHLVCDSGDLDMAEFIIDRYPNEIDEMIGGALMSSAPEITKLLLDRGASTEKAMVYSELYSEDILNFLNSYA